ncbi:MAG: ATP-binding protein [Lachnospiraceae bacterium]|nr:ATP-binding protein [Lachnospiraceae bacterium]
MFSDDKRIRIIVGHYGSGKTEFAVNYTFALKREKGAKSKVAIADLDIINIFFRSREKRGLFEKEGIRVISSSISDDMGDLPALSPEIPAPILDKTYDYIIDLGGNDVGTNPLGRIKDILDISEVDLFMVVNTNRPDTAEPESIIAQKNSIERYCGLKITGFINNTNLIRESSFENMVQGDAILKKTSELTGIPVKYTTYVKDVISKVPDGMSGYLFPMDFYMREKWM